VYQRVAQRKISSMHDMGSVFNVKMTGHHHSGIDDCRNIAKLLIGLLRQGISVDLTWGALSAREQQQPPALALQQQQQRPSFASSLAKLSAGAAAAMQASEAKSRAWQEKEEQVRQQTTTASGPTAAAAAAAPGGGRGGGNAGGDNDNRRQRGGGGGGRQQQQSPVGAAPPNGAAAAAAASGASGDSAAAAAAAKSNNSSMHLLLGPVVECGSNDEAVASVLGKGTDPASLAPEASVLTQLSKRLSNALRHNALQWNIPMSLNGWVKVASLIKNNRFNQVTPRELAVAVSVSDKQRFSLGLGKDDGQLYIRANQGHSIEELVVDMEAVTDAGRVPIAVHGTTIQNWEKIRASGLSRMQRQHVHFASGLPGEDGVISGMRARSQVLIYLDVKRSLAAGLKIYRSANGVILTPGLKDGFVPTALFEKVIDATTGRPLSF
jgi:2'-phosphotransferase